MHALNEAVADLLRAVSDDVILRHFQQLTSAQIVEKSPGELVTIADHESEERLNEGLLRLLPEASLVGEEAAEHDPNVLTRIDDSLAWVIDPIDGTHNFAHGHGPFGIIIALVEGGETIAGWLYDPLSKRLCHASKGKGAFINGEKIQATTSGQSPPIGAISTLFLNEPRRTNILNIARQHYQLVDVPRCAAEQYPRLILGTNDVTLFERTLPWDHAAGVLFLEEAGGMARRADGSRYRPSDKRTGMIASANEPLWDQAARLFEGLV